MHKKVLTVLSEYGYWGEELVGPVDVLEKAGYEVEFATPTGKPPVPIGASLDPSYVDPPLDRTVTTPEVARKTAELAQSGRLDEPLNLAQMLPERPYFSSPRYVREMEDYYRTLDRVRAQVEREYEALLLVGGSGPVVDMVNNYRVHDLIRAFLQLDRPIAAECYAVTCLVFARSLEERRSILWGKHVTGHPVEYDYKAGWGFEGTDFVMGYPPYPLEYILRDAVGPEGQFHGNVGKETSVVVDYPFITGRSTSDGYLTGEKLVEVLEHDLRHFGFVGA